MASDNIDDVLAGILDKLSGLPLIGTLAEAVVRLHDAVVPLIGALKDVLAKVSPAAPTQASSAAGSALNKSSMTVTTMYVRNLSAAGGPTLAGRPAGESSPPGGVGGAAGGLSQLAKVGAIAAAALGVLVVAINIAEEAFNKAKAWVNLFNPGIITIFQQHLDNLGATIGRAFVPVFTTMTAVVRSFTATLAPIMAQLAPVMQQFADVMGGILLGYIKNFASLLRGLVPIIQAMIPMWKAIAEILVLWQSVFVTLTRAIMVVVQVFNTLSPLAIIARVLAKTFEGLNVIMGIVQEAMDILSILVTTIVDGIVEFVASFIPVEDIMHKLKEAVQFVIRNMYVFSIMLARLTGLNTVADNLIKHVEGKLQVGDTAAQTPQIKDLEALSRDLALAAAMATGAGGGSKVNDEREFWKRTLEEMKAARDNGKSVVELLEEIKTAILNAIPGGRAIADAVGPPVGAALGGGGLPSRAAVGAVEGALGLPGLVLGGIARNL